MRQVVSHVACDVCGSDDDVKARVVGIDRSHLRTVDLCAKHREFIDPLISSRRRRLEVMTMDQIAALKRPNRPE